MKVLVTGDKGFIGKNLVDRLKSQDIEVIGYDKENSYKELEEAIECVDFIFHLAGEVKPKCDDKTFEANNLGLTQVLVDLLERYKKNTPILMTSTIHAIAPKNAYGATKRDAEKLLLKYSEKNNSLIYIYRLPHVFGEGCKPNYNSVLTTWIHNSLNDLEIVVYDRKIKMSYVYVQDVVQEFVERLNLEDSEVYYEISKVYPTTLGEVVDFIMEFKANNKIVNEKDEFRSKLLKTYNYYLGKQEEK